MATSTTEQKKRKEAEDAAKEEILKLLRLHNDGKITYKEYCKARLPFVKVLGTSTFYNEDGELK